MGFDTLNNLQNQLNALNNKLNNLNAQLKDWEKRKEQVTNLKKATQSACNNNYSEVNSYITKSKSHVESAVKGISVGTRLSEELSKNKEKSSDSDNSIYNVISSLDAELRIINSKIDDLKRSISSVKSSITTTQQQITTEKRNIANSYYKKFTNVVNKVKKLKNLLKDNPNSEDLKKQLKNAEREKSNYQKLSNQYAGWR